MLDFCIVIITNVQLTSLISSVFRLQMKQKHTNHVGEGSEKLVVYGQRLKRFIRTAKLSRV